MKKNKLGFKLIDMGLKGETLANLTESELRLLYNKLNEQPNQVMKQQKTVTSYTIPTGSETEIPTGGKMWLFLPKVEKHQLRLWNLK